MIYAAIDVNIVTHPKAMAAGVEAMGLWLWAMAYSQLHELDGRVPRVALLAAWGGRRNVILAQRLTSAGLLVARDDGDWDIWNYDKKNQSSDEIKRRKDLARSRYNRWQQTRLQRVGNASPTQDPNALATDPNTNTNTNTNTIYQPMSDSAAAPAAAPVPDESKPRSRAKPKLGARLSPEWTPSEATIQWAKDNGFGDPSRHVAEFRDYWCAVPGQRGTKLDWDATFRNRLRDLANRGKAGAPVVPIDRPKFAPGEFAKKLLGGS